MVNNTDLVSIIDPFVGEGVQTNSDFLKNMENLQFETSLRLGHFLQVFLEVINFLVYWRTVGFVGIVGFLIYLLFWRPYNRYRDLTELGYDEANTRQGGNNVARMNFINDMRKARKVGVATALYPNGWFVVMESRLLKKTEAKEANYFGKTFVVWRGSSGQAYIADGYCPHIGAHLGVMGLVKGDCIECPFHGWTFEGTGGTCVKIPYADPSSIPKSAKLKLHTSLEMNGFIFIWYHDKGLQPTWTPRRIPEVDNGRWKYRGRSEFRVSVHAQEIAENIADTGHFAKLHETSYLAGINFNNRMLDNIFDQEWKAGWYVSKEADRGHESFMEAAIIHKVFKRTILNTEFGTIGGSRDYDIFERPFWQVGLLFDGHTRRSL
ncbi:cholesterol 7-desaturase [Folsomia candida]|uniref:cholesterol 7-desaturase n=1 Tax=Folsomia candida TaxID=158441 RepID=UPI001604AFF4|nr:cholesterol 7-desaturase [Folsomia candida]